MHASRPVRIHSESLSRRVGRALVGAILAGLVLVAVEGVASAQTIVYRPVVTGFAPAAGPYVANYTPSGNYAAVTAFSPPVMAAAPVAAISTPVAAVVPASSVAVTSYATPAMTTVARPVTAYYAPSYASTYTTTSYYAPAAEVVTAAAPFVAAAPVVSAPVGVTSYYAPAPVAVAAPVTVAAPVAVPVAPAAVAVPLYRRGPFGGLRPVRGAYWGAY